MSTSTRIIMWAMILFGVPIGILLWLVCMLAFVAFFQTLLT